jgi:hypothetical protein
MTCISPPELEVRLLMAFLDGEADPETRLHLQKCEHCRDRAKTLEREQKLLTSRLYRASCPSTDELGEFHLRILPSDQMLIISQHVRECPLCTREINQLKEFLGDLVPVTEGNLVQQTKRLVARLVGGGGALGTAGQPSFALRGESDGPLTFEVGGILIVIDIQQAVDGKLKILGQVAAEQQDDWTAALVKLKQEDQPEMTTTVDDLGAFRFEGLSSGPVDIQIEDRDGTEIVIPTFESTD